MDFRENELPLAQLSESEFEAIVTAAAMARCRVRRHPGQLISRWNCGCGVHSLAVDDDDDWILTGEQDFMSSYNEYKAACKIDSYNTLHFSLSSPVHLPLDLCHEYVIFVLIVYYK